MTVLDDTKRLCFKNHLKCISINGDGEKDCINNILKLRILSRKFSEDRELGKMGCFAKVSNCVVREYQNLLTCR